MRFFLLTLVALAMPMPAQVLHQYRDSNRVVLLFAPSATDPRYLQQRELFRHHEAEFKERDVVILPVITEAEHPVTATTVRTLAPLSPSAQQALRLHFRIAPGEFSTILIGKDGGEKLRSATPLAAAKLNAAIDAMPMRQKEMRRKQ